MCPGKGATNWELVAQGRPTGGKHPAAKSLDDLVASLVGMVVSLASYFCSNVSWEGLQQAGRAVGGSGKAVVRLKCIQPGFG